ncbi:MAG: tyrosine-type recombinase/integrase [Desulfobacterales bacterium]|nr:MAG: tyrosine-type recombinase/integrase [Desulfobacterales bacterium]
MRPSEQVALKWETIDDEGIYIGLSRVRNREKSDLKNEYSRRRIELRPAMREVLEKQREQVKDFDSPYVFLTQVGTPIIQDRLRDQWSKAMTASGLTYRRIYETRHTFASWALGAGELPEWVARTLGHADTSMIYRTYGRYIPNLTRQDGSAFERQYRRQMTREGGDEI